MLEYYHVLFLIILILIIFGIKIYNYIYLLIKKEVELQNNLRLARYRKKRPVVKFKER